jgi:hypothetical protein
VDAFVFLAGVAAAQRNDALIPSMSGGHTKIVFATAESVKSDVVGLRKHKVKFRSRGHRRICGAVEDRQGARKLSAPGSRKPGGPARMRLRPPQGLPRIPYIALQSPDTRKSCIHRYSCTERSPRPLVATMPVGVKNGIIMCQPKSHTGDKSKSRAAIHNFDKISGPIGSNWGQNLNWRQTSPGLGVLKTQMRDFGMISRSDICCQK